MVLGFYLKLDFID